MDEAVFSLIQSFLTILRLLLFEPGSEFLYAFAGCGVDGMGRNLCQRLKHKVAQGHQRVGDGETRCFNDFAAVEQNINVYYAVVVYAAA